MNSLYHLKFIFKKYENRTENGDLKYSSIQNMYNFFICTRSHIHSISQVHIRERETVRERKG